MLGGLWGTSAVFGDCSRLPRTVGSFGLYLVKAVLPVMTHTYKMLRLNDQLRYGQYHLPMGVDGLALVSDPWQQ